MQRLDIHERHDFFEYVRLGDDSLPAADPSRIDVALLDMNHSWPNIGHNSLAHAVLDAAADARTELIASGLKVRVISFDVRRRHQLPQSPNGRFQLYVGTGGPGHLDPRENDGKKEWAQGISESTAWEAPLFKLFESIVKSESAALIAICHSFGLMCRWAGVAHPELRYEKSSGMPLNTLTDEAQSHPYFSDFSTKLGDRRHFRVVDNRLFDLVLDSRSSVCPLATESKDTNTITMVEFGRERDTGMPRVLGVNHHPEIIDRQNVLAVLEAKRAHGEVDEQWFHERADMMKNLFHGERERQSRLTSEYVLLRPLRHHVKRLVRERGNVTA